MFKSLFCKHKFHTVLKIPKRTAVDEYGEVYTVRRTKYVGKCAICGKKKLFYREGNHFIPVKGSEVNGYYEEKLTTRTK